jgi:hypothetical protein
MSDNLPAKVEQGGALPVPAAGRPPSIAHMPFMPRNYEEAMLQAKAFANSDLVNKRIKGKTQVVLGIILIGRNLGLVPMQALQQIAVFDGKAIISALLIHARMLQHSLCEYVMIVETTATSATYETLRHGNPTPVRLTWTIEQAKTAGLIGNPNKPLWKKFPAEMLRSRCVAALGRMVYPDALAGFYTPDEAEDMSEGQEIDPGDLLALQVDSESNGEGYVDNGAGGADATEESQESIDLRRLIAECSTVEALKTLFPSWKGLAASEQPAIAELFKSRKAELEAVKAQPDASGRSAQAQNIRDEIDALKASAGLENFYHLKDFQNLGDRVAGLLSDAAHSDPKAGEITQDEARLFWSEIQTLIAPAAWSMDAGKSKPVPRPSMADANAVSVPTPDQPIDPVAATVEEPKATAALPEAQDENPGELAPGEQG